MSLSNDLISQLVKANKSDNKTSKETTVYGTTVEHDGVTYVKLDGSDLLTPVSTTSDTKPGERVTVMIKNHSATITGNISSPSASATDVKEVGSQITEFEIIMAYKITTEDLEAINATIKNLKVTAAKLKDAEIINAKIHNLEAKFAELEYVDAKNIEAITAEIEDLRATFGEFEDISTENLEAAYADIDKLKGYTADFTYVSADVLQAIRASIKQLDVEKLSVVDAEIKYANIDFTNIGKAAMEYFYAKSGLIDNVQIGNATITGELVGVTLKGDLIEAGTLKADRLVVKGSDGIYYKLNFEAGSFKDGEAVPTDSIHGSVITAKSITAEKVSVNDLVAFDATIGGFKITDNAIHSIVKESVDNTTRGIYMDNDGQFAVGDSRNFLKYHRFRNGNQLADFSEEQSDTYAGIAWSCKNGVVTAKGTSTDISVSGDIRCYITGWKGTYFISDDSKDGLVNAYVFSRKDNDISYYKNCSFTLDGMEDEVYVYCQVNQAGVTVDTTIRPMLNEGEEALPWETYSGGYEYRLEISAESIVFSTDNRTIEDVISDRIDEIHVGTKNLIRNSTNLIFSDYYFSGELIINHDNNGNVIVICGASVTDDGAGNVIVRTSASTTDDGNGNVVIK